MNDLLASATCDRESRSVQQTIRLSVSSTEQPSFPIDPDNPSSYQHLRIGLGLPAL